MDWIQYWNGSASVYVNERHRRVHYALVAEGIAALVPQPDATVLDYGCGEALSAGMVKARCGRLLLCDAAETVRDRLRLRFDGQEGIEVISPDDLETLAKGSIDLVVVNSVVQYLNAEALGTLVRSFRRVVAPHGRIVFADIVPREARALDDARALLVFGARNGFLLPALVGLVRTAFSDYRRVRTQLGLSRYAEYEFRKLLEGHGLSSERIRPNLGHDQGRMAFSARFDER